MTNDEAFKREIHIHRTASSAYAAAFTDALGNERRTVLHQLAGSAHRHDWLILSPDGTAAMQVTCIIKIGEVVPADGLRELIDAAQQTPGGVVQS